jgi:hypothetical protein
VSKQEKVREMMQRWGLKLREAERRVEREEGQVFK